jgi:hypothetical protein
MDWERFFIGVTLTGFAGLIVAGCGCFSSGRGVVELRSSASRSGG